MPIHAFLRIKNNKMVYVMVWRGHLLTVASDGGTE